MESPAVHNILPIIYWSGMWDLETFFKEQLLRVFSKPSIVRLHQQAAQLGLHFDEECKKQDMTMMEAVSKS